MLICNVIGEEWVTDFSSYTLVVWGQHLEMTLSSTTHHHYAYIRHTIAHGQHGNEVVGFGFKFIRFHHPCGCDDQAIATDRTVQSACSRRTVDA
ncbi:unnamed protein product [Sphagnum balticum]